MENSMVTENSTYIEFNDRREAVTVSVDDRAATRQIIIEEVRQSDFQMTEGASWGKEHYNSSEIELDWNYTKIAIHHSGKVTHEALLHPNSRKCYKNKCMLPTTGRILAIILRRIVREIYLNAVISGLRVQELTIKIPE